MKNATKIIGGLTVFATLALSGCGGTPTGSSVDEDAVGYQYADTSAPIVKAGSGVNFDLLAPKNALALDYNSMKVFSDLESATNIHINWSNLTETAYAAKKNTIMADKTNYPDAIYHAGFTDKEMIQYHTKGVISDLGDYLDYMPNFKALLTARPDIKQAITFSDGGIYSLPRIEEMGLKPYPNLLFLNKTFAQKLIDTGKASSINAIASDGSAAALKSSDLVDGLKMSRNNYKAMLTAFKDNNIDGNGDTIPLDFVYGNWQGNQADLFASFGIAENVEHKTILNGKVTWTADTDTFKGAVNEISSWISDGLIPKTVFEQSQDAFLASGKASVQKLASFYWWESATVVSNPSDYIVMQPLVDDASGKQYVGVANNLEIEKGEFVLFEKCANKKILLTYLDRFYDPYESAQLNYGPKGIVFEDALDANGKLIYKDTSASGLTADELRLKNAPMGCTGLTKDVWGKVLDMESRAQLRLQRLTAYETPYIYSGAVGIPNITYTSSEINKLSTIETSLSSYLDNAITNWLIHGGVGQGGSDSWDTYTSKLNTIGYQDVLSINQAGYDRYLAGK